MFRKQLRACVIHVGAALREPELFALRWHQHSAVYPWSVFAALGLTAMLGTISYGMTMGVLGGAGQMIGRGLVCTLAAGIAWSLPLPALYVLNGLTGSRLSASTMFLAALVTTSWGGLAMMASIPINLFFTAALPYPGFVLLVNVVVFAGVGVSMVDVFGRVMARLEPERGRAPIVWLVLVGAIGAELFFAFGLFQF